MRLGLPKYQSSEASVLSDIGDIASSVGVIEDGSSLSLAAHESSPKEQAKRNVSREGLRPGDIVFFKHTDDYYTHVLIRGANAAMGHANEDEQKYIHVEICTGIDDEGRALITGATGGKVLKVRTTTLEDKLTTGGAEGIRVHRPQNDTFASKAVDVAKKLNDRNIGYSKPGCIKTLLPNAVNKQNTSDNSTMFCSEFVVNVMRESTIELTKEMQEDEDGYVLVDEDIEEEVFYDNASYLDGLASVVTPGTLTHSMAKCGSFLTATYDFEHAGNTA